LAATDDIFTTIVRIGKATEPVLVDAKPKAWHDEFELGE
jgi:hypothetical protein